MVFLITQHARLWSIFDQRLSHLVKNICAIVQAVSAQDLVDIKSFSIINGLKMLVALLLQCCSYFVDDSPIFDLGSLKKIAVGVQKLGLGLFSVFVFL